MQTISAVLTPHRTSACDAVRRIGVHIGRMRAAMLCVTYHIDAAPDAIRIPEPARTRAVDGLWRSTCCELFIRPAGDTSTAYHELNFSPSGEWAAYAFESYRAGQTPVADIDPVIELERSAHALTLSATVALGRLEATYGHSPVELAISAVIETEAGALSYWALEHPSRQPDFHHPSAFALTLP